MIEDFDGKCYDAQLIVLAITNGFIIVNWQNYININPFAKGIVQKGMEMLLRTIDKNDTTTPVSYVCFHPIAASALERGETINFFQHKCKNRNGIDNAYCGLECDKIWDGYNRKQ